MRKIASFLKLTEILTTGNVVHLLEYFCEKMILNLSVYVEQIEYR